MSTAEGQDLLAGAGFIQPDDGNPDDETVLRVPLPQPVEPGGTITLQIDFSAQLPRVFARTGYRNEFHLAGQWFPKIGVLEERGWNCHQFHNNSEFFADFGRFDVRITVPSPYVVGATGALQGEPEPAPDGTTTYHYVQDDVHDFAWTADPRFIKVTRRFVYAEQRDAVEEARVAHALGLPEGSDELALRDVDVTLLIQPEHAAQIDRHFSAVFAALLYFGTWYGSYPYATLTVVDPAYGARGAGGMEYPTFITAGTNWLSPSARQSPEGVTIHEFGHQFWYGMVANNEFEEAFLDEGFNTYSTGLVLEKAYGPNHETIDLAPGLPYVATPLVEIPTGPSATDAAGGPAGFAANLFDFFLMRPFGPSDDTTLNAFRDVPFLNDVHDVPIDQVTAQRRRYLAAPKADILARRSWEYLDRESYGLNSYSRTALMLRTLRGILGPDLMLRAMRTYHQRYRFRHPHVEDFIATVIEVAGPMADGVPLEGFFRQAIFGSDVMDYAVDEVESRLPRAGRGVFGPPDDRKRVTRSEAREEARKAEEAAGPGAGWEDEVVVRRLGEFVWPQDIEIRYEEGTPERTTWDGSYRWTRIRETGAKLAGARVDPEERMALDINRSNNSRSRTADHVAGLAWWSRVLQWMQHVAYFYSGIS